MLASSLMAFLEQNTSERTVLYYFCSSFAPQINELSCIYKCMIAQLVRKDWALSACAHKEYVERGLSPTTVRLKTLLCQLLSVTNRSYICVDGIDECTAKDQTQIINGILSLVQPSAADANRKALFTSRDIRTISKHLKTFTTVALSEQRNFVDAAIKSYVRDHLTNFRDQMENVGSSIDLVPKIEHELVSRAEGWHFCLSSISS